VALPVEIFEAGYSKDQELEADREGTRLVVQADILPAEQSACSKPSSGYTRSIKAKAKTPQEELSQVALETLEGYFRSHPLPSERIAQIQKMNRQCRLVAASPSAT